MCPCLADRARPTFIPRCVMRQIVRVSVGLLLLAMLVGCGPTRRSGVVSGKVTYKGQAVNDAALLLYPAGDAKADPVTIPVTEDGSFRITDLPPGEYKVVVQGAEGGGSDASLLKNAPPEKRAELKSMMEGQKSPTTIPFPNKYKNARTSDLRCTVTDKNQTLDLVLTD
jgi:hypothetical protein